MTNLVLWSGGYDSTLVLYHLLNQHPNDHVTAVSIINKNLGADRLKCEKKSKNTLLKIMEKRINYKEIKIETDLPMMTWQMPAWLSHIAPYIQDGDTLNMGYLSSDGFSFFDARENFKKTFNATMELQGKNAEIKFPLESWTKGEVINNLKEAKLLKHCWYCGLPKKGKPCGRCMKCISVKRWSKFPDTGENV